MKKNYKTLSLTPLPCYSDILPPEIGSRVVVKCNRVDDSGVWGTLPDWDGATFNCEVYLPLGYIAKQRGRGERKAQAEFLTRAKRLVSKGKAFHFVGEVDDVDEVSCNAVADSVTPCGRQITQNFLLTVHRRGLSNQDERQTIEASKATQYCATLIVDKAAVQTDVPREQARQWCLYGPFHKFGKITESGEVAEGSSKGVLPGSEERTSVAAEVLIKQIGKLPEGREKEALNLLCVPEDKRSRNVEAFITELVSLCRIERVRTSKPIPYVLTSKFTGSTRDVSEVRSVFAAVLQEIKPPAGLTKLKITSEGAGKYTFSTTGSKEKSETAMKFLESASSQAMNLYATAIPKDPNDQREQGDSNQCKTDCEGDNFAQPTLNIGLIGDVANGKSTMVKAITGKRTQSHSAEQQKHGMTIRLGFANASILHCGSCDTHFFRQDEVRGELDKLPICSCCNGSASVVTRVSFIDCPGHAELMATMISGASAFDGVVLAASSNIPCPSPQARQHLHALRASGRDFETRIAVAQTKAELLAHTDGSTGESRAGEKLAAHASSARENLQRTVASNAPFFPTCAPIGAGLEPLASWLANLALKGSRDKEKKGHRLFRTLRSFDVNYAGVDACKLVGGVLGGSVSGYGSITRGEMLEIRPGLPMDAAQDEKPSLFKTRPIQFQVEEIMTGKNSLDQASAGGLVALRTTLDPALCADDGLIGSVVGPTGTLPPVWGPTVFLDKFRSLDTLSPKKGKRLKKASKVRIHAGSATVTGRVMRVSYSNQKVELLLDAPICASKCSNLAIEAKFAEGNFAGYTLVAYGSIADGTVCVEGVDDAELIPDSTKQIDVPVAGSEANQGWGDEEWVRDRFLKELKVKKNGNNLGSGIISVPRPVIAQDGGAHVLIENFSQIAQSLNRDAVHLQSYLHKEAGLSCTRAGVYGGALRVRVRSCGFAELMGRILCRYVSRYVTCHQCRSAKTEFLKKGAGKDQVEMLCRQCNARRFVLKIV